MKKFKVRYKEYGFGKKVFEKMVDNKELFWLNLDWAYEIINIEEIS